MSLLSDLRYDFPMQKREIQISNGEKKADPILIELSGKESSITVSVGSGSTATIFDTSSSADHRVHIEAGSESVITYVSLSRNSVRCFTSTLKGGASIHWHCTTLGAAPEPHTLVSTLSGRNATSDIDWIFRVRGDEKQSINVRNIFGAENGGGEITLKGVAEGKSYASCDGMIEITEAGRGTNTYLTEDVLMLDPTAKIDAIPGLEIRTNDVKASHSATVSRVTPEDLFYFQSRGIPSQEARRMYTEGFLGELTDRIPDASIRAEVLSLLI